MKIYLKWESIFYFFGPFARLQWKNISQIQLGWFELGLVFKEFGLDGFKWGSNGFEVGFDYIGFVISGYAWNKLDGQSLLLDRT